MGKLSFMLAVKQNWVVSAPSEDIIDSIHSIIQNDVEVVHEAFLMKRWLMSI